MSEEKRVSQISPGEMRPSQLIQGFGPGSILSMKDDAIMILGCQVWPKKDLENKRYEMLDHPLLSKVLNITHLRMPFSRDKARVIPAISFPQWGVCKQCKILQKHGPAPRKKSGFTCKHCEHGKLMHARLVVICERGHIDEFPWVEWLHRDFKNKECPESKSPMMKFEAQERTSGLGDYALKCLSCKKAWTTIAGSVDKKKFYEMPPCRGWSPWLGDDHFEKGGCIDQKTKQPSTVRGIQIRAPSLYYPLTISAIKIPEWTHPVFDKLNEGEGELKITIDRLRKKNNLQFSNIVDTLRTDFQVIENILKEQKKNDGIEISDEDIKKEIIEKLEQYFTDTVDDDIPNQIEILNQEFDDIQSIQNTKGKSYENEFQLQTSDITGHEILEKYLSSLKQISRITSISALYGFTRSEPPDPLAPNEDKMQYITTGTHRREQKWLPGVQNVGEGVFFSLNPDELEKWERLDAVKERCNTIVESFAAFAQPNDEKKSKDIEDRYNRRFILLHTLSHLIIKQMARYAGYNEASLKERIYWDNDERNGILIYASSGTSEGSLGGLVRLGRSDEFARILKESIKKSRSCSRDPICGETDPVSDKVRRMGRSIKLTGSACHSCCIVPETSCAFFNQLLDRWTVSESGFFRDFE